MDLKDLKAINAESAKFSENFYKELMKLVKKSFEENSRMTLILLLHIPINTTLSMIAANGQEVFDCFPELPHMFSRFMKPFEKLEGEWGKISGEEFVKKWGIFYNAQFDSRFSSKEKKEEFTKWFEEGNKK